MKALWRVAYVIFFLIWFLWVWEFWYRATLKKPESWVNVHIQPQR